MRTMYDGITPSRLPADAQLVAGYLTGPYAWKASDWARFPNVPHVQIATQSTYNVGNCLDVETGDATPTGAVQWVKNRRAAGVDPSVYCNASTWPAVRTAFAAAGVAEPHYWIAKYDQNPALPAGAVAKQHTNTTGWDLSSVADYWPGVDPAPEDNMAFTNDDANTFLHYNYIPGTIPAAPAGFVSVAEALTAAHNSTAAIAAIKAEVDTLKAATVAPVATVDLVALAKAVCDEQDARQLKRDSTAV